MLYYMLLTIQRIINIGYKSVRFFWRIIYKLDTFNEAFWLAFLSQKRMDALTFAKYRGDKVYTKDENTRKGLFNWEQVILDQYIPKNELIIIIGAGGGRETYSLLKSGYSVKSFEAVPEMVAYANNFFKNEGLPVIYNLQPINTVPKVKGNVWWLGWGLYTHLYGRDNRVQFLKEVRANLLNDDGIIVISYWRIGDSRKHLDLVFKLSNRLSKRKVEMGECFRYGYWAKYFSKEEIRDEAERAGLMVAYINHDEYGCAVLTPG
ncbi:hypothetical protein ACT3CD_06140 [Geofilum sp. OHC36d9]|uniref:hypothetical protein n=1 Tax=Geofilum sp. OHC36d9 TaxID=3458413 RepID=UPI004034A6E0